MADEVVGRTYVEIVPDLRHMGARLRRDVAAATKSSMGDVDREVKRGLTNVGRGPGGRDAGTRQGRSFQLGFTSALANLGTSIRSRLADVGRSTRASVEGVTEAHQQSARAAQESAAAERALVVARQQVTSATLAQERAVFRVAVAEDRLNRVKAAAGSTDADRARATFALRDAQLGAERAASRVAASSERLTLAQRHVADANADVDNSTRRTSFGLDLFNRTTQLSRAGLRGLVLTGVTLAPALVPAIGAVAGLTSTLGVASGVLAGIPALALTAATGIGTLFAAFRGIGDAVKALGAAEKQSGAAAEAAARVRQASMERIREATNAVAQAQRTADRTAQQGAEQVAAAARRVADVRSQAAERVADAERDLTDAQRAARDAQLRLTEAREAARERLEDLALSVRGAALDERDAVLDLERARRALAEAGRRGVKSGSLEHQELALAAERAALRVDEVRERSADLRKEAAEGARVGVEGDRQVISAKQQVADANRRTADAERALNGARVQATRDVAQAQAELAQTQRDVAASNADAARAVAEAQRELANAYASADQASRQLSASQRNVADAMDNLSPAGRQFALFLHGTMLPALRTIGDAAATSFLPPLQTALTRLLVLAPVASTALGQMGATLGRVAVQGATMVTSGPWRADFATLATGNARLMGTFGQAGLQVADAFRHITVASLPMVQRFADATLHTTQAVASFLAAKRESGALAAFFQRAGDMAAQWGRVVANLGTGLFNMFRALLPSGQSFLDWLERVTGSFRTWSQLSGPNAGPGKLASYMQQIMPQLIETLEALGRAFGAVVKAAGMLAPGSLLIIRALSDAIVAIPTPVLAGLIAALTTLNIMMKLVAFGTMAYRTAMVLWMVITKTATAAQWLLNRALMMNPIGLVITALVALGAGLVLAYKKSETFRRIVDAAWRGIATAARWAWNNVIKPAVTALVWFLKNVVGPVYMWLWRNIVAPAFRGIGKIISFVWNNSIKPTFEALKTGVRAAKTAFSVSVEGIKTAWNKIKEYTRKPVAFVVNTVYNNGLRKLWNQANNLWSGKDLAPVKFEAGGRLPMVSPMVVNRPTALVGEGNPRYPEYVIPTDPKYRGRARALHQAAGTQLMEEGGVIGTLKKVWRGVTGFVRDPIQSLRDVLMGPLRGLAQIRNTDFGRGVARVPELLVKNLVATVTGGGAAGGPINPGLAGALQWARSQVGKPYLWGGVGPAGYDCSGFMSAIINVIRGSNPYRRLFATGSMPAGGLIEGLRSAFQVGWFTGNPGHTAGTLNGVNVESRGGRGVLVGPAARGWNDPMFNRRAGLAGYAAGGILGDPPFDVFDPRGRSYIGEAIRRELFERRLIERADSGGLLAPGGVAVNMTRRPELMTPTDTPIRLHPDDLRALARAAANVGVRVFIGATELTEIIDVRIEENERELTRQTTAGVGGLL